MLKSETVHGNVFYMDRHFIQDPLKRLKAQMAFWSKVSVDDPAFCWKWNGGTNTAGYGRWSSEKNGPHKLAHRWAWMLFYDQDIPDNKLLMHRCDNPICCNPFHLEPGTDLSNIRDSMAKGRFTGAPHKEFIPDSTLEAMAKGELKISVFAKQEGLGRKYITGRVNAYRNKHGIGKSYKHLSQAEKETIDRLIPTTSMSDIAKKLHRANSTISNYVNRVFGHIK